MASSTLSNPTPSHPTLSHRIVSRRITDAIRSHPIPSYPILSNPIPSYLTPSHPSFVDKFFFKVFQRRLTSKNCGWIHESTLVVLYPKRFRKEPRTKLHCCLSDVWAVSSRLAHNEFTLRVTRGDITWKEKTWREALSVRATFALAWKTYHPNLPPIETPTSCILRQDPRTRQHRRSFSCLNRIQWNVFWLTCLYK